MRNIVLKYGLIAGLILVAMIYTMMGLVGDTSDFDKWEWIGFISMAGAFSMIFFAIRDYRDKIAGGVINFNYGFRIGIQITIVASFLYVIGWMIYFNFIDDSFIVRYTEFYERQLNASGKAVADIAKEMEAFKKNMADYNNPWVMAMSTFLEVFPVGLVITILCAFLMKRNAEEAPKAP
jgi:Flp pilus assembly pilin Flp